MILADVLTGSAADGLLLCTSMGLIRNALDSISARLEDLLEPRRVLEPNAKTRTRFAGHVVGHFRRQGPNSWDDYQLVAEDGGPIDVYPSIEVQAEPERARFRMRARGRVVMVQWVPTADDHAEIEAGAETHDLFRERCVEQFKHSAGIGVAGFIARTLRR